MPTYEIDLSEAEVKSLQILSPELYTRLKPTCAVIAKPSSSSEDKIIWKETSQYCLYAKIGTNPRFAFIDYSTHNDSWEVIIDNKTMYSFGNLEDAKKYVENHLMKGM